MTGTESAYYPNKNKDVIKKNIKFGKIKNNLLFFVVSLSLFIFSN